MWSLIFLCSTLFSRHFLPDKSRPPPPRPWPAASKQPPKPPQIQPTPSRMSPRLAAAAAALIQRPQRSQSPPRLPTSEPTMARGDILPPSGRTGANKTHKNNTKDTTINRNVDGGTRGRKGYKITQQSAGIMREKWAKMQQLL